MLLKMMLSLQNTTIFSARLLHLPGLFVSSHDIPVFTASGKVFMYLSVLLAPSASLWPVQMVPERKEVIKLYSCISLRSRLCSFKF